MKKLVLSSLMSVVVSQAAGCVIEDGTPPPPLVPRCVPAVNPLPDETATIQAQWSLKSIASSAIIPYPPGITTAAVYAQEVDDYCEPIGEPIIDLFSVGDNQGRTDALPPSFFQVWVELTSQGGSTVHAKSLSAYVDVSDTDKTFTTTLVEDGGYFQLDWNLVGENSNRPLTCAQAGLAASNPSGIYIEAFLASSTTAEETDIFSCADGTGVTGAYLAGRYDVLIDARTTTNTPVGVAPTITTTINDKNRVTDLGVVTIPITGL
jgi:hypothetical protein